MENDLLQSFMRIINHYNSFSNEARNYGIDETLFPSEIHLIDAIGKNKNMTTTKLANILGITKGGISQTVSKLMKKGLVTKSEGDGINEVYILLSDKGKKAYEEHLKLHEPLIKKMNMLTKNMDEDVKKTINEIISSIDDELTRLEEDNDI